MIAFESILDFNDRRYHDNLSDLDGLIRDLGNGNGKARRHARISLIRMGKPALDGLIKALNSRNGLTRWEAAKALSQIGSRKAAPAMVKALEDDQFGVRWLAAEGLIKLGHDGLKPLLEALWQTPDSVRLRAGAHHILHDLLSREGLDEQLAAVLRPVSTALNYMDPAVALPPAVMPALKMLQ